MSPRVLAFLLAHLSSPPFPLVISPPPLLTSPPPHLLAWTPRVMCLSNYSERNSRAGQDRHSLKAGRLVAAMALELLPRWTRTPLMHDLPPWGPASHNNKCIWRECLRSPVPVITLLLMLPGMLWTSDRASRTASTSSPKTRCYTLVASTSPRTSSRSRCHTRTVTLQHQNRYSATLEPLLCNTRTVTLSIITSTF